MYIVQCTMYIVHILYINPVSDIWFWPLSEWPGCYFWWPAWWWRGRGGGSRSTRRWRAWWGEMWRAWRGERGGDWPTGLDGGAAKPLKPLLEGSRAFRGGPAKLRWHIFERDSIKFKIADVHFALIRREVFEGPHSQEYWSTAKTDKDWGNPSNQNSSRYIGIFWSPPLDPIHVLILIPGNESTRSISQQTEAFDAGHHQLLLLH